MLRQHDEPSAEPASDDLSAEPASDDDSIENGEKEEPLPALRRNRSRIWEHFDILDKETRTAQCILCAARLSYRSTNHNLRKHLERRHALTTPPAPAPAPASSPNPDKLSLTTNEIWQYFEIIDKKQRIARCAICLKSLSFRTTTSNLVKHLQRKHLTAVQREPKFQEEYLIEETEEAPDLSEPEFVETPKQNCAKRVKRSPIPEESNLEAETSRRSDRKENGVIDAFGAYVTMLMKQLPEEVAMRMQGDIVSQLINAQLANQSRASGDVLVLHATTSGGCDTCEISNSDSVVT